MKCNLIKKSEIEIFFQNKCISLGGKYLYHKKCIAKFAGNTIDYLFYNNSLTNIILEVTERTVARWKQSSGIKKKHHQNYFGYTVANEEFRKFIMQNRSFNGKIKAKYKYWLHTSIKRVKIFTRGIDKKPEHSLEWQFNNYLNLLHQAGGTIIIFS